MDKNGAPVLAVVARAFRCSAHSSADRRNGILHVSGSKYCKGATTPLRYIQQAQTEGFLLDCVGRKHPSNGRVPHPLAETYLLDRTLQYRPSVNKQPLAKRIYSFVRYSQGYQWKMIIAANGYKYVAKQI